MTSTATVRRPANEELGAVATAYGRANAHDPVLCWVIPDEEARLRMISSVDQTSRWIGSMLDTGEVLIAEDASGRTLGVSLWELNDGQHSSSQLASVEYTAFIEHSYGPYAPRMKRLVEMVLARHPRQERHWYLEQIVVDPEQRSRGIGSAMLRHQLARVDAEPLPAYLEASSPRNQALYERHGFRPLGAAIELPDNGPHLQPMWRDARS